MFAPAFRAPDRLGAARPSATSGGVGASLGFAPVAADPFFDDLAFEDAGLDDDADLLVVFFAVFLATFFFVVFFFFDVDFVVFVAADLDVFFFVPVEVFFFDFFFADLSLGVLANRLPLQFSHACNASVGHRSLTHRTSRRQVTRVASTSVFPNSRPSPRLARVR